MEGAARGVVALRFESRAIERVGAASSRLDFMRECQRMRRMTAILSVAAVVTMSAGSIAQVKPSFAGDWMMVGPDGLGDPGATLTITQTATTMVLEYKGCVDVQHDAALDPAPMPEKRAYALDGSASRNTVAGRGGAPTEQVSTATWAGNRLVVTTAIGVGEEKRAFSLAGDTLVIETSAPAPNGGAPNVTRATYTRYECGYGG